MAEDDRQLVLRCRDMHEEAYQELMHRYEGYVYRLCYNFAGNREDALDLAQETFIRVFKGLDTYQLNRAFKPWLRRITVNTCISFLEKRTPPALYIDQPSADGTTLGDILASSRDPAQEFEWKETGRIMKEALNRLSHIYRLLIILRHQEDLSYQEIADETNMPLGTVKTYLFRARAALRKEMSGYYAWGE